MANRTSEYPSVLGVDIGSVAVSCVLTNGDGCILAHDYAFHHGNPAAALRRAMERMPLPDSGFAACTSATPDIIRDPFRCDSIVAYISSARLLHPDVRSILLVGGERFGLVLFSDEGRYRHMKSNTSCAAGTGSFLDQQARRLQLKGSAELSAIALANKGQIPKIASRCSVFAKTDIIHAQQEGYSLEEICDGLCFGLARNISDSLFNTDEPIEPAVFAGGVSLNDAVKKHLESSLNIEFLVDENSHLYGAYGACLRFLSEENHEYKEQLFGSVLRVPVQRKTYHFPPLKLENPDYPDFEDAESYRFQAAETGVDNPVEVDLYGSFDADALDVYLGIDVGSTSTKAVLLSDRKEVIAGFYTRTSGKPISAVQGLFEAIDQLATEKKTNFTILGAGTTGSGRNLIGAVVRADLILDEISAHARGAYELDPEIDTIIEIGGQDSKFTTLKNGMVTFSHMNTVCAAGTGSFIEEQAQRLDVPLSEYSDRAMGKEAPLASDRCTVFMERDINNYLNKEYDPDEILAAALYSVRENYLQKVASNAQIGKKITFQGATAKNKALVAAFEQKLGCSIFVSKYCHLTGALGTALMLADEGKCITEFRGLDLYKERIPVETEVCDICKNHCRICIASVKGRKVAFGFLCGRDYQTERFVARDLPGLSLFEERKKIIKSTDDAGRAVINSGTDTLIKIGVPAALHLFDDLGFWKVFFAALGAQVVTSENHHKALAEGTHLAGAEFCAPVAAFHGHCTYLAEKADYLFIPIYVEDRFANLNDRSKENKRRRFRKYCYYTQFAPSLVKSLIERRYSKTCLTPVVDPVKGTKEVQRELEHALRKVFGSRLRSGHIRSAYERAVVWQKNSEDKIRALYTKLPQNENDIDVVLLGRPYTILSDGMNKRIPAITASLGARVLSQDMLPSAEIDNLETDGLLDAFHWNYAAKILQATSYCAQAEGMYPILVTSFKCAPDSFLIEYFRRIMEKCGKPYLILQLDEHDSTAGYETRLEAGMRAFRNHRALQMEPKARTGKTSGKSSALLPRLEQSLDEKTILFPNWDPLVCPLIVANLRWFGYDARPLEEDEQLIRESMRNNTGQCIPVHIILEEFAAYVKKYQLEPAKTVLWMIESNWSCNIRLYPYYMRTVLDSYGEGLSDAGVYSGSLFHIELSKFVTLRAYFAYLFGGLVRVLGCKIRPYEVIKGTTNRVIDESRVILENAFLGETALREALESVISKFESIERIPGKRPKVAIFGDIYVRDNHVMNQSLIEHIEDAGGEVITTPYSSYLKIVAGAHFKKLMKNREIKDLAIYRSLLAVVELIEKHYEKYFIHLIPKPIEAVKKDTPSPEEMLGKFNISLSQEGESYENILKILHIKREYPDVALFIQTNPAFCCPSIVTEAMGQDIERVTGVPIVSLTYDGTGSFKNDVIIPYLQYENQG